jgi:hypothetical protein
MHNIIFILAFHLIFFLCINAYLFLIRRLKCFCNRGILRLLLFLLVLYNFFC